MGRKTGKDWMGGMVRGRAERHGEIDGKRTGRDEW